MVARVVLASAWLLLATTSAWGQTPPTGTQPAPATQPAKPDTTPSASPSAIDENDDLIPPPPIEPSSSRSRPRRVEVAQRNDDQPPPPPVPAALPDRPRLDRVATTARDELLQSKGHFANPGNIGRHAEYYTAFTPLNGYVPHSLPPATFGNGGLPTREQQIEAVRVGAYRGAMIQNHIDAYGRPIGFGYFGLGYGYGYGLGGYPR